MVQQHNRYVLADCPMGAFFVVVPTSILQLFLSVCKTQEHGGAIKYERLPGLMTQQACCMAGASGRPFVS